MVAASTTSSLSSLSAMEGKTGDSGELVRLRVSTGGRFQQVSKLTPLVQLRAFFAAHGRRPS